MLDRSNLHSYQRTGVDYIKAHPFCGLFLDMGLGKTATTLTAIEELGLSNVLVIAPKRVAQTTWKDELTKWAHLRKLTISVIDGTPEKRRAAIQKPADIYTISRDLVVWLLLERKWKWKTVVIDELSSFKSPSAKRFKALKKVRPKLERLIGLTGTPAPNGYIDLWSQLFLIDCGERLGKNLTAYRDNFFRPGRRNGDIVYEWICKDTKVIDNLIADVCTSMKAEDYLSLPPVMYIDDWCEMSGREKKLYTAFKEEMILSIGEEPITAQNAAVLSQKLQQYANGAIYDEDKQVHHLHDAKIDMLKEIVEGANGQPVLVAYNFQHDLNRIQEAFPDAVVLKTPQHIADWNAGKIQMLVTHPASAGHGLNLQKGGNIVVWFSVTWSLELYQQFNARLYRQGQEKPVYIHHILTRGTVDENIQSSLGKKSITQNDLLLALWKK